jgi:methylated-DNA-[protein]-cysteine S-methyltransferase
MDSPVGKVKLIANNNGLVAILWESEDFSRVKLDIPSENKTHPTLLETEYQLREYFDGKRKTFDIALDLRGTVFQKKVWTALLSIPFGATKSYGTLAKQMGDPKTVRAVGGALNKNPISIIVPCHRVIGTSGQLTGFAGGPGNKAYLLNLENTSKQPSLWGQVQSDEA